MPQASSDTPTSSSIVEALQAWFRTCPRLTSGAKVGVDWLPDEPLEYAIYATPTTIRTRENVLGEEVPLDIQTQNFIFASKERFGADIGQNLNNQAFYESIIAWIWEQNERRNLPQIPNGTVKSIVPTLTAFIAEAGADTARYQIQLKLTYRRL